MLFGIIGNNAGETARVLLRMCQTGGYRAEPLKTDNGVVYVACGGEGDPARVRVLVAQDASPALASSVLELTSQDYLLANADEKEIFPILTRSAAHLITFGFNAKACVTASSITESALQVCVQRGFVPPAGPACEPQEFAALTQGEDPAAVLGAAAACLLLF